MRLSFMCSPWAITLARQRKHFALGLHLNGLCKDSALRCPSEIGQAWLFHSTEKLNAHMTHFSQGSDLKWKSEPKVEQKRNNVSPNRKSWTPEMKNGLLQVPDLLQCWFNFHTTAKYYGGETQYYKNILATGFKECFLCLKSTLSSTNNFHFDEEKQIQHITW